uniref:ABC transporter domain-containing protein n=2 Tax=Aegilops tauschii subsp. strangulata TaxID=200361 RepID=A0A453G968_AEGTS
MPPAPAALLLAAPAGLSPWRPCLRASRRTPPRPRLRAARIRAAATVNGEFGGLGRRRLDAGEFIGRLRNVLPGGSWWRLEDEDAGGAGRADASGATAASALSRMWALVANDRWVIFAGFASLICAALAEIAIPHLLAASIFSAQNGGAVFYRNAKLLVVLCMISGVFRYAKWLDKLYDVSFRQTMAYGGWSLSLNYLYHSTQVVAVLIGGIAIMNGKFTAEQLTKFTLYAEWLILSTWWIGDNWSSLMQSVGASLRLQKLEGRIQYADVEFSYPSRPSAPILRRLNLTLNPNEVVAIVGLSGSGKSTIVNLLLQLYEPTNGQILIDGVPLSELDTRWFRERIGFVGQEPKLFRMDVTSNIKYGCPREVSQEEVEWAAKQAYAHDFLMALPDGYNTIVDDALLSGGQKQRVAIARALLRDPAILVLDEATSALDAESEHYVKSVITEVSTDPKARRTVIIIAHRLSTIQAADRIIVMENGSIVEDGKHSDLVKQNGLYSRLAQRQNDALP